MTKIQNKQTDINTSYYLVKYYGGGWDDNYEVDIFVTNKKSKATKYVTKFNRILKKWKKYYKQFETVKCGIQWISDEYVQKHYDRWNKLRNITRCYYEEVEFR